MKIGERAEKFFDERFGKYKWYNSFKGDYGFRTIIFAIVGALINIIFACVNGVTALRYMSLWYGVFAGYYLILALQRLGVLAAYRAVLKHCGDDEEKLGRKKLKIYLTNGAVFVPLDIALGAAITVAMLYQKPTITGEIMAITTATYTVYKIISAARNLVKAKKATDPIVQTLRNIGFVDALASVFSLEVTLITTFSETETVQDMRVLMVISGFVVCAFTVGLGSYMIISAVKKLRANNGAIENE